MSEKTLRASKHSTTISLLYAYLFSMMSANVLLHMPILGGAFYVLGRVSVMGGRLRQAPLRQALSKGQRRALIALLIFTLPLMLVLVLINPVNIDNTHLWLLAVIVLLITLRPLLSQNMLERDYLTQRKNTTAIFHLILLQLAAVAVLTPILFLSVETETAWSLLAGFAMSSIFECAAIWQERGQLRPHTQQDAQELEALRGVHAYRMYQNVSLFCAAAFQVTQVMTYTYIGISDSDLILLMALALLCTYTAYFATDFFLKRAQRHDSDPSSVMTAGLVFWLYGLILFFRAADTPTTAYAYISLALCTGGASICMRVLSAMDADMRRVAAFAIGHEPSTAVDDAQNTRTEFAALLGQVLALAGLTLICLFVQSDISEPLLKTDFAENIRPLLVVPALVLVAFALVFTLRFPMTKRHLNKLRRYVDMQQQGYENAPLHEQLEAVVVRRSLKRHGVRVLMAIIRPLYYHRILGRENVELNDQVASVFVCNHGEIYGPIVTNLYVPFDFRPWVTFEMLDKEAVTKRTEEGFFSHSRLLTPRMRHRLARFFAPLLVWVMKSVDSIPVYHDNPRKLMQTFRETTLAMEAGDSILLFPENADTSDTGRYQKEGVSEFFTGFTTIGQTYYNKTGKCAQFVPLYASKTKRTITFGVPTHFDPELSMAEEKTRLCDHLRGEMMRIAQEENTPRIDRSVNL